MSESLIHIRRRTRCLGASLAVFIVLVGFAHAAFAATVTATVDHPVVTLGETLTLSLTVDGGGQQLGAPDLPAIPGFNTLGGQSLNINNNGAVQQSFTYELQPVQAGEFTIPAFRFTVNGQASSTQPIKIKVLQPGAATGGAPPPAFVKINLTKTNLYVGEVVDLEVQVYFQEGRVTQYPQLPADPGFTVGKWAKPTQTRMAVSNLAYGVCVFKAPITPVKAGALTVGPLTYPLVVPDRTRRPSFFGQPEKELRLIGEQFRAIALPLPATGVSPTFAGAVGQYSVSLLASPTSVAVGDPITVRVKVVGRGWLDSLTLPPQPQWSEFKMYAPNAKIESGDPNNVSGSKNFEVVLTPQNAGVKALPPFAFSYFDPEAGGYRTVSTPAVPLQVSASPTVTGSLPPVTATNAPVQPVMNDIVHIRLRMGDGSAGSPILAARGDARPPGVKPWFIALQCVAPAVWLALVARRKRAEALLNNPRLRRRREVHARVKHALAEMRSHAEAKRGEEFFAALFRVLQEQIGERLDVPANSVTEAIIDDRLRPAGLPEGACHRLHELFQAANLARYAPTQASHEMAARVPKTEQVIRELQNWEAKR